MSDARPDLTRRIAVRAAELRAAQSLSLDALARKTSVSRSMISLIERGETCPTAVVLEKLAAGLGVTLSSFFDAPDQAASASAGPVMRRNKQPEWRDPGSGYVRRNISPPGVPQPVRIVEISFPAGARVAFETSSRKTCVYQQVWVIEGEIDIVHGTERHKLHKGDCMAMQLNQPTMFHNSTRRPTRYVVVTATESFSKR